MNTNTAENAVTRRSPLTVFLPTLIGLFFLVLNAVPLRADIPDNPTPLRTIGPAGYFRVISSSDPLIPMNDGREWFLDFGSARNGKTAGTLAVSVRKNPDVKVRIMVWQLLPESSTLIIGNQVEEGSKKAVARGQWKIRPTSYGYLLTRENYQVSLRRANPEE